MEVSDYRSVIGRDYRPVVANFGPQAGALAHLMREGAEASLCGIPKSALAPYEDLDEPICASCIAWHSKLASGDGGQSSRPVLSPTK